MTTPIKLINHILNVISTYNSLRITPTTHIEQYFITNNNLDENARLFITECFYGMERYEKILNVTMDGL
jgi:hypothetical protein